MSTQKFITLIDTSGRRSSLGIGLRGQLPQFLEVVGVLPHGANIKPDTAEDRAALVEWLAPGLLTALENAQAVIAAYVKHEPVEMCAFAEAGEAASAALARAKGGAS